MLFLKQQGICCTTIRRSSVLSFGFGVLSCLYSKRLWRSFVQKVKIKRLLIMNRMAKIVYWVFVLWAVIIILLNLNANIAFGYGLGDVYYLLLLVFFVIVISIINFKVLRGKENHLANIFLLLFILVIVIAFTLKLTTYRWARIFLEWEAVFKLNR